MSWRRSSQALLEAGKPRIFAAIPVGSSLASCPSRSLAIGVSENLDSGYLVTNQVFVKE
jgi:hypothetical protein